MPYILLSSFKAWNFFISTSQKLNEVSIAFYSHFVFKTERFISYSKVTHLGSDWSRDINKPRQSDFMVCSLFHYALQSFQIMSFWEIVTSGIFFFLPFMCYFV